MHVRACPSTVVEHNAALRLSADSIDWRRLQSYFPNYSSCVTTPFGNFFQRCQSPAWTESREGFQLSYSERLDNNQVVLFHPTSKARRTQHLHCCPLE